MTDACGMDKFNVYSCLGAVLLICPAILLSLKVFYKIMRKQFSALWINDFFVAGFAFLRKHQPGMYGKSNENQEIYCPLRCAGVYAF